ncbi:uncharacterized protein CcaverHIS019_0604100 [Cutaneotrichosporon cavernicola]|uniref:SCP domain-containing protein n=1 Tax=Cutaneotrichosporon cavernicola TaxID=279322 RepID=A0AA48L895_9TREE|nr:uncharacterized protein CcaverHIS019_0604100 [Cutaneotrichosporon cavernicola]BEI93951.1 hypothetical protein CcaverHIS019_0604100 [Cutaneotrichosporon cavernicola]BEJ09499.1 hypothetical protein CcaverHIS641_0604140 [Cutaneotrichosporon cavernicola]
MRVLALFTLLTALAAPAAARSHPRRQCKAKHTPSVPSPHQSGTGNNQLNIQPEHGQEEQPPSSAGSDSAVQPSKPVETPAQTPEQPAETPATTPAEPSSSAEATPSSPATDPSPTESPKSEETPESAPGSEAEAATPSPSQVAPTPSEGAPSLSEEAPSPSEAAPTPSEAAPSPSEAAPSPSEATPSASEPAPSPTGTAPDAAFTQPSVTDPAQTGPDAYQQTLLDLHNNLRRQYSAGPVTWNQGLADYAAGHADKCVFEHSGASTGENLAGGTGSDYDLAAEFQMWANEANAYNFDKPGYSAETGHFTQAVWKGTTQIGCAWKACAPGTIFEPQFGNSLILVCEYEPRGNYVSNNNDQETAKWFSENVGPKA